jgi:predicted SprT family Zn-dependent metalloprotease
MDLRKELYYPTNTIITKEDITKLANKLLDTSWKVGNSILNLEYSGWTFGFNKRKSAGGICNFRTKTISLSLHYLEQNLDKSSKWEDIIRHEIAHALDMMIRGKSNHDRHWKHVARTILCSAKVTFSEEDLSDTKKSKYTLTCPTCNDSFPSHRKKNPNKRSKSCCLECYNKDSSYIELVQTQNY